MRAFPHFTTVLLAILTPACSLDQAGVDPVQGTFNFPAEVALSPALAADGAPAFLFVANANFDLRYNGGTVMSLDAMRIAEAIRDPAMCPESATAPCVLDPSVYEINEVRTGSFPGGMAVSTRGDRIYVPIRSDGNLTYIDVDDSGRLSCVTNGTVPGNDAPPARCDDGHRRGDETIANQRGEAMPADPVRVITVPLTALDAAAPPDSGDAVIVADVAGAMSFFIDERAQNGSTAPQLIDVISGLASGLAGLAYDPTSQLLYGTSTRSSELARVGVALDLQAHDLRRSFLFKASSLFVGGLDDGRDTRDIHFDPANQMAYVLSRRPEVLLVADMSATPRNNGELPVEQLIGVSAGPSRLTVATIGGTQYAFISCYDARTLYVIDLDLSREVGIIRGFSGPFQIAVDSVRNLLYVADFRGSNLRVVDLAPLTTPGADAALSVVAFVGTQRPRSELH
ncbi:MAG: hypothetical protein IPK60_02235 [Sandaracinaceae bacterium]|nr:hypothetical protein [Sandaracinaceae bacterium]